MNMLNIKTSNGALTYIYLGTLQTYLTKISNKSFNKSR